MYTIATLEDLRRHLNLGEGDRGSDDALLRALQDASHLIESATLAALLSAGRDAGSEARPVESVGFDLAR